MITDQIGLHSVLLPLQNFCLVQLKKWAFENTEEDLTKLS